ncbi:hypothetical protein N7513_009005 [Penicillium frequentans]|nr:hypothetical protein N7513_009005 [Penicillium glabrum]
MVKKMLESASDRGTPSCYSPNSSFSLRRRDSGSRIPRPTPYVAAHLDDFALGALEDCDLSDISDTSPLGSPNVDERPLLKTAIPLPVRQEENRRRLPLEDQATMQAASVRLVNVSRGNSRASNTESTRDFTHGSHQSPNELSTISENSRCSTTASSEYHSFLQSDRPLLRVSLSAGKIIMGDEARSKSLPNITDERRSRGIFRPRIIRNFSPSDAPSKIFSKPDEGKVESQHGQYHDPFFPAERVDTSQSSMEGLSDDPINHGSASGTISHGTQNGTPYSGPVFPPRTSSLNALSSLNSSPEKSTAWSKVTTVNSSGTLRASENLTFLDICQSHPEVAGNIIQTGVVINPDGSKIIRPEKRTLKTPAPRMSRVMGGIRNVFSRSRSEKRSKPGLTFEMVNNPIPTSRPVPQTPTISENGSPKKSSKNRVFIPQVLPSHHSGQFGELETKGLDSVRQTLNGLGRLLVEDDDIERRRVWYRYPQQQFIRLYSLLADFNSRDLRIGEAASLVAQMRAEASLRRYAMILQVHQISQDHDALYAADLPSDQIVEDWEHARR